jgi:hypothetical protein
MPYEQGDVLKVGDIAEFYRQGYPQPDPDWHPQVVEEIHIVEDPDDKEGVPVQFVDWRSIRNYERLVVVIGTENWGRNDQIRPASKIAGEIEPT